MLQCVLLGNAVQPAVDTMAMTTARVALAESVLFWFGVVIMVIVALFASVSFLAEWRKRRDPEVNVQDH